MKRAEPPSRPMGAMKQAVVSLAASALAAVPLARGRWARVALAALAVALPAIWVPPSLGGEVSYPPRLPGGKSVISGSSPLLLKAPPELSGVRVARSPPEVDFMYYPGQTYAAKTWSNWGDGTAVEGKYYSAIGDHNAPEGNAFVYEYDAATKELRLLVDLRRTLQMPPGHYTPGKIHGRVDLGSDGWLYFATHRGSTRVTTDEYHYQGDWIVRHHPAEGRTEILAGGPVGKHCIPASMLDPQRLFFYGGTVPGAGAAEEGLFFAFDTKARKVRYAGRPGPARYMLLSASTGRVYFVPGLEGPLYRYDPAQGGPPVQIGPVVGLRAATAETPDGYIYAVSGKGSAELWRIETRSERIEKLGAAAVGSQDYIASLDADPSGRYLYYVPGAHGGSHLDGTPVVQFDVRTRTKKVIAFLHPFLHAQCGYLPLGTFGSAVDAQGDKLYITFNGSLSQDRRGQPNWDACALVVIHIPSSEREP